MSVIDETKISALEALISTSTTISVITHRNPDGDAAGSSCAIFSYLTEIRGKNARILVESAFPDNVSFLPEESGAKIICANTDAAGAEKFIHSSDLIFCVDLNVPDRMASLETPFLASAAKKVLIDHHVGPAEDKFDLVFSKTDISSASELMMEILLSLPDIDGNTSALPTNCLTALMTGITTDTNNFANSVYPSTLRATSELLASGVDRDIILGHIYNECRENRLRLMGHMLSDKLVILPWGVAYMILDRETAAEFEIKDFETDGFVNLPLSVKEVKMSLLIKEEDSRFRVSLRSKAGISARDCAVRFFHGGGHEQASGGKILCPDDISSTKDIAAYIEDTTRQFMESV